MLVQYTQISALDTDAQERLKQAASGLLRTNEAHQGFVMFEGKYFSVQSVQALTGGQRQVLNG